MNMHGLFFFCPAQHYPWKVVVGELVSAEVLGLGLGFPSRTSCSLPHIDLLLLEGNNTQTSNSLKIGNVAKNNFTLCRLVHCNNNLLKIPTNVGD